MPHPITLILKDRRGNTLDLYELDPAAPLTLDAVAGAYYQFNDETTGFAPQNLHTRRSGDALHVSIDGHDALTINHYYSRGTGTLIGLQENGGMQRYPLAPDAPATAGQPPAHNDLPHTIVGERLYMHYLAEKKTARNFAGKRATVRGAAVSRGVGWCR